MIYFKSFSDNFIMLSRKKDKWSLVLATIVIVAAYRLLFVKNYRPILHTLPINSISPISEEIQSTLKQGSYSSPRGRFFSFYVNIMPGPDEPQINQIFLHLFNQSQCARHNLETFIVDVGLNVGYFSLLASTYDCFYVLSLDPQIYCHQLYRFARSQSKLTNKWNSYQNPAWFKPAQLRTQKNLCDAGYSLNVATKTVPQDNDTVLVQSIAIDSLPELQMNPSANILVMKIDTEGAEIGVLLSCQKLIEDNRIDNFIIELMNHQWPVLMKRDFSNFEEVGLKVLSDLQKKYEAILLADAEYSEEIIAWSTSSPVKSNPLQGFSAVIPEGSKGFPVLLQNRKALIRGCNIWFRRRI